MHRIYFPLLLQVTWFWRATSMNEAFDATEFVVSGTIEFAKATAFLKF